MIREKMAALAKKHILPDLEDKEETIEEYRVWMEKEVVVKKNTEDMQYCKTLGQVICTLQGGGQKTEDQGKYFMKYGFKYVKYLGWKNV